MRIVRNNIKQGLVTEAWETGDKPMATGVECATMNPLFLSMHHVFVIYCT
jgi:hypothetical protein